MSQCRLPLLVSLAVLAVCLAAYELSYSGIQRHVGSVMWRFSRKDLGGKMTLLFGSGRVDPAYEALFLGPYGHQAVQSLTRLRESLESEIHGGGQAGLDAKGHARFDIYPPVISCPPNRPLKKYGGKLKLPMGAPAAGPDTYATIKGPS
jgi:hypothetical protein